MYKIVRHIVLIATFLMAGLTCRAQEGRLITFLDGQFNYLRWTMHPEATAYQVYRDMDGVWQALDNGRIPLITDNDAIRDRLGGRTDLLLGLLGLDDRNADITIDVINRAASQPDQFELLQVYTLMNPDYAEIFGLIFIDDHQKGNTKYKVTAITSSGEVDWVTSEEVKDYQKNFVPIPGKFTGLPENKAALLSWDKDRASLENGDVVSYHIYRSNTPDGNFDRINFYGLIPGHVSYEATDAGPSPEPNRQKYGDFDLINGQSYFYQVKAVNAFGIESAATETVEVIPNETDPPPPPKDIAIRNAGHGAFVSWTRSDNVAGYEIERSPHKPDQFEQVFPEEGEALLNISQFIDFETSAGVVYYYRLRSVNNAGMRGPWSVPIEFIHWDKIPPAAPLGVRATATDEGKIVLSWWASTEEDVIGYHVERANDNNYDWQYRMNMKLLPDTIYIDDIQKESQTTYGYVVYAVDRSLNQSPPSEMVFARLPDIVPPQAPIINGLDTDDKQVTLSWIPVLDEDLETYRIYRSIDEGAFEAVHETKETTFEETQTEYGQLQYRVTAIDAAENESAPSLTYTAELKASPYPDPPVSGNIDQEDGVVSISWSAPVDDRVTGFLISRYRGDGERVDVKELAVNDELSFEDKYVRKGQRYLYEIRSKDKDWQLSKPLTLEIKVR